MATLEDVVNVLIEQTKNGTIIWTPNNWDEDGTPRRWMTSDETKQASPFDLMGRSATLNMLHEKRWITLGQGGEVQRLVDAVAATAYRKGTTRDEALQHALSSLTTPHQ